MSRPRAVKQEVSEIKTNKDLESIADSISALVTFASRIHDQELCWDDFQQGVIEVKSFIMNLANESSKTVSLWQNLGFLEMSLRMSDCSKNLGRAIDKMVHVAGLLASNSKDVNYRDAIVDSGKAIICNLVNLMDMNGLYEAVIIMRSIKINKEKLSMRNNLKFVVHDYSLLVDQLVRQLNGRMTRCYDPKIRDEIQECASQITKLNGSFKLNQLALFQDPKQQQLIERNNNFAKIIEGFLRRANIAVRDSTRSPFDLTILDQELSRQKVRGINLTNCVGENIQDLVGAVCSGELDAAQSILDSIRRGIESEVDIIDNINNAKLNHPVYGSCVEIIRNLNANYDKTIDQIDSNLEKAVEIKDPAYIKGDIDELKKVYDPLAKLILLDQVTPTCVKFGRILDDIVQSVSDDIPNKQLQGMLIEELRLQAKKLEKIGDDSFSKLEDQSKRQVLESALQNIRAKEALIGESTLKEAATDAACKKKLIRETNEIKGLLNDVLHGLAIDEHDKAVSQGLLIENALNKLIQACDQFDNHDLRPIQEAVVDIDNIRPMLSLIKSLVNNCHDPEMKKWLLDQQDHFQDDLGNLVNSVNELLAGQKSTSNENLEKIKQQASSLQSISSKMASEMIDIGSELQSLADLGRLALENINHASEAGDQVKAVANLLDLQKNNERKQYCLEVMARNTDDEDLKHELLKSAQEMNQNFVDILPLLKSSIQKTQPIELSQCIHADSKLVKDVVDTINNNKNIHTHQEIGVLCNKLQNISRDLTVFNIANPDNVKLLTGINLLIETQKKALEECDQISLSNDSKTTGFPMNKNQHKHLYNDMSELTQTLCALTLDSSLNPSKVDRFKTLSDQLNVAANQLYLGGQLTKTGQKISNFDQGDQPIKLETSLTQLTLDGRSKHPIFQIAEGYRQKIGKLHQERMSKRLSTSMDQDMFDTTQNILQTVKEFSSLDDSQSKNAVVQHSQEIGSLIQKLDQISQSYLDTLTDSREAQNLKDAINISKNISTQIKILSAVKVHDYDNKRDSINSDPPFVLALQSLCKSISNFMSDYDALRIQENLVKKR